MPIAKHSHSETAAPAYFDASSLRRICCLALIWIVAISTAAGKTSKPGRGVAEGTVWLHGEPVRKAGIVVIGPPYTLDNSFVVPIITPRLVGALSVDEPPSTLQVYYSKTEKKGRYLVNLPAGRYELSVTLPEDKKHRINKIVTIEKGQKLVLDFDFSKKWGGAEQDSEGFIQSLNQVAAAAKELHPMRAILFTPLGHDSSFWIPTVILPGADDCDVVGLNSMKVAGQSITLPMYVCRAKYETQESAEAAYRELTRFIAEKMVWKAVPGKPSRETKFEQTDLPPGDEVSLELSTDGIVNLVYTTGKRAQSSDSQVTSQASTNSSHDNAYALSEESNGVKLPDTAGNDSANTSVTSSDPAALVLTLKAFVCLKHCRGELTLQKHR